MGSTSKTGLVLCLALFVGCAFAYQAHKDIGFTYRRAVLRDQNYIGFKDVISDTNVGQNYFNQDYGFFRVERPGLHVFSFSAVSDATTGFTISLRVDGVPKVFITAQAGYVQASNSATLYLKANQVVYLYLENESSIYEPPSYRGYTTFSGHRVNYDPPGLVAPRTSSKTRPTAPTKTEDQQGYDYNINNVLQTVNWQ